LRGVIVGLLYAFDSGMNPIGQDTIYHENLTGTHPDMREIQAKSYAIHASISGIFLIYSIPIKRKVG